MTNHYDIVIVGGGILGCATAFSLARQNAGRILVIERTTLGAQTTSRAASLVTRSRGNVEDRALITKTRETIDLLRTSYKEDIDFRKVGSLHIAESDASAQSLHSAMADLQNEDIDVQWQTVQQACEHTGWLGLEQAEAIAFVPDDGYVDPYIFCAALARAAKSHGVSFVQGEDVIDLTPHSIRTDKQEYTTSKVIVTAGPWVNMLLNHIPCAPVRSQYWMTQAHGDINKDGPVVVLPDAKAYARPEVGGLLFGIRDDEAVYANPKNLPKELSGFSFNEDYEGWDSLAHSAEAFMERFPLMNEIEINHYISGPSSYTPDGQFVIGEFEGFLVAAGACGAGISICGGVGESLGDLVMQDKAISERYDPNRFGRVDGFDPTFLEQCALARSRKRAG